MFLDSNVHCGSGSHERIQYGGVFPEVGNVNGSNADVCSDVAGPSSSGSGDLIELSDRSYKSDPESFTLVAAMVDLSVTTTLILPFGACYVIMHRVF